MCTFYKGYFMWYVYILYDPRNGKPFYVGKGNKRRLRATLNTNAGANPLKRKFLEEIKESGLEPITEIVGEYVEEDDSLLQEKQLIENYGRIIKGTGILVNYADGGEQGSTGHRFTDDTKKLWSSQRRGVKQSANHIKNRVEQTRGKKRTDESKRKYVLASIRRTNPELKVNIINELESTIYYRGLFRELSKKLSCDQELISRIHNNIELYKEALNEWIKK